jgi:hypothetical protein
VKDVQPPPTARELYLSFAQIAISGFGGVMAWSRRMLVNEKRWLSPAEFNELYALCQIVPGPDAVNLTVMAIGSTGSGSLGRCPWPDQSPGNTNAGRRRALQPSRCAAGNSRTAGRSRYGRCRCSPLLAGLHLLSQSCIVNPLRCNIG